mmetsp:Transcript_72469/g.192723  ORF Transcript_72469/g.192723 Transcript_72469/m.192723 type:complete len:298 (+) Transcript_72469:882-1775(+)
MQGRLRGEPQGRRRDGGQRGRRAGLGQRRDGGKGGGRHGVAHHLRRPGDAARPHRVPREAAGANPRGERHRGAQGSQQDGGQGAADQATGQAGGLERRAQRHLGHVFRRQARAEDWQPHPVLPRARRLGDAADAARVGLLQDGRRRAVARARLDGGRAGAVCGPRAGHQRRQGGRHRGARSESQPAGGSAAQRHGGCAQAAPWRVPRHDRDPLGPRAARADQGQVAAVHRSRGVQRLQRDTPRERPRRWLRRQDRLGQDAAAAALDAPNEDGARQPVVLGHVRRQPHRQGGRLRGEL